MHTGGDHRGIQRRNPAASTGGTLVRNSRGILHITPHKGLYKGLTRDEMEDIRKAFEAKTGETVLFAEKTDLK